MADASYVIDIAAEMGGGDQTLAELDSLVSGLTNAGKGADHFQQAIKQLSGELNMASAATEAANLLLAQGQDEYAALEKAAIQAGKAAERAAAKNGGVIPRDLQEQATAATNAVNAYAGELRKLEANATGASKQEAALAQQLRNVQKLSAHADKTIASQAEQLSKLGGALGAVGGPLGRLGQSIVGPVKGFAELSGTMGSSRAAALLLGVGAGALAAAIIGVGVAAVAATVKVAAWAVGLADARREGSLTADAFDAMNPTLAGLPFGDVAAETGLASDRLRSIAKSLQAANVSAEDLPEAFRAAALAERALGQGGASEFIDQIADAKGKVSELAAATQQKLGGIVARQMLGIDAQSARLRRNIGEIFGGLNIDPVLQGMGILVGLFDKSSAAGQAMRFLFESVFQPLIDQATKAAYVVEAFALGFLIGLTKVYIAVKPAIKAVSEFFGIEAPQLSETLELATLAGKALVPVFLLFSGAAVALATGIGLAVAAVGGLIAGLVGLPFILTAVGNAIAEKLGAGVNAAINYIRGIDVLSVGRDLIAGLAAGVTSGAGAVINAITGAVKGAIATAKNLLGIASPSKVFAELGAYTGEGFTQGVEAENDNAQAAMAELASPEGAFAAVERGAAPAGEAAAASTPTAAVGGGPTINVAAGAFVFHGVKDAEHAAELFEESLTRLLEGDALALGGSAEEAA